MIGFIKYFVELGKMNKNLDLAIIGNSSICALIDKFGKKEYLRSSFANRLVVIMNQLNYATVAPPVYIKYQEQNEEQKEEHDQEIKNQG